MTQYGYEDEWGLLLAPRYAPFFNPAPIPDSDIQSEPSGCIELNETWAVYIASALDALDQPDAWQGDDDQIFAARQAVQELQLLLVNLASMSCNPEPEIIETVIEKIIENTTGCTGECECDDMPQNPILHIGGKAYLAEPCGCGETNFYPLESASVNIADDGKVTIGETSSKDVPTNVYQTTTTTSDCYQAKAVTICLNRVSQFAEDITNLVQSGVDALLPEVDDLYEFATLAYEAMSGADIINGLMGPTGAEVESEMSSRAMYDTMLPAWTFTGPVSRSDLLKWAEAAPWAGDLGNIWVGRSTPRGYITAWATFVNIQKLNDQLQLAAAVCAGNGGIVPDAPVDIKTLYDHEGTYYWLYDMTVSVTLTQTGKDNGHILFPTFEDEHENMVSIAAVVSQDAFDDMAMQANDDQFSRTRVHNDWDAAWIYRTDNANHKAIFNALLNVEGGPQELTEAALVSSVHDGTPRVWKHTGSGNNTYIHRVLAIAEVS